MASELGCEALTRVILVTATLTLELIASCMTREIWLTLVGMHVFHFDVDEPLL